MADVLQRSPRQRHKQATTSAAALRTVASGEGNARAPGGITVQNTSGSIAYLGGSDVTADNNDDTGGFQLPAGASHWFPCNDPSLLYCRTATGTAELTFYY